MTDDYSHLPPELNVPFECSECGSIFSLFGPEDGSDLCDCEGGMYKVYISDAGRYMPVVELLMDKAEEVLRQEREAWSDTIRDDLEES